MDGWYNQRIIYSKRAVESYFGSRSTNVYKMKTSMDYFLFKEPKKEVAKRKKIS